MDDAVTEFWRMAILEPGALEPAKARGRGGQEEEDRMSVRSGASVGSRHSAISNRSRWVRRAQSAGGGSRTD